MSYDRLHHDLKDTVQEDDSDDEDDEDEDDFRPAPRSRAKAVLSDEDDIAINGNTDDDDDDSFGAGMDTKDSGHIAEETSKAEPTKGKPSGKTMWQCYVTILDSPNIP